MYRRQPKVSGVYGELPKGTLSLGVWQVAGVQGVPAGGRVEPLGDTQVVGKNKQPESRWIRLSCCQVLEKVYERYPISLYYHILPQVYQYLKRCL